MKERKINHLGDQILEWNGEKLGNNDLNRILSPNSIQSTQIHLLVKRLIRRNLSIRLCQGKDIDLIISSLVSVLLFRSLVMNKRKLIEEEMFRQIFHQGKKKRIFFLSFLPHRTCSLVSDQHC